jgi:hypothetical protein
MEAGFDPSVENFKDMRWAARQNFSQFVMSWKKIKMNYELSHILRTWDDKRIDDEEVRSDLKELWATLTPQSFQRNPKRLTDDSFAAFRDWVMEYEMNELYGLRHEIWKLP